MSAAQRPGGSAARVTDAAAGLLGAGVPWRQLSVEQILAEAGVARSTFYQHFDDKGAVLRVVGHEAAEELTAVFRRWPGLPLPLSHDDLHEVLLDLARTYRDRAELFAAMTEAASTDETVRGEFHAMFDVGRRELTKHLRAAARGGHTRDTVDPTRTAGWVIWMIERGLYQQVRHAKPREVRREVAALTGLVFAALYDS